MEDLATSVWPAVHVVGIGDGGAESLASRELALIASADLLCGGERHLAFFPEHPAERFVIKSNIDELIERLRGEIGRRRVLVLASGDPCFLGIAPIIAARLGRERVVIHPHPSSVALAFARLGTSWQDATVLSAHGRPLESIVAPALAATTLAVLTDPRNTPAAVGHALRAAGMEDAPTWVGEHLGGPLERVVETTLHALAGQQFASLNVVIIRRDPANVRSPITAAFGCHEDEYESLRGQITKAEVRAVTLSKLQPWQTCVAWDVGAGSGSLATELAGLMSGGAVYAIERDGEQIDALTRNLERHCQRNVHVVAGAAPEALAGLPRPDAVFIGGSGGELSAVLDDVAQALLPGGRLVANFAKLESLAIWQSLARRTGWAQELVQISISRGAAIGGGTRLVPLGPVFITTLIRPEETKE